MTFTAIKLILDLIQDEFIQYAFFCICLLLYHVWEITCSVK